MGRICPRCRYHVADAAEDVGARPVSDAIPRCPNDGCALVPVEAMLMADGDPFLGATVAGRFVILGKLGAGSMGTVYRARQEAVGRDVAIKILRSDRAFDAMAKARFTREARAMSLLSSPHTVTVFDFGEIPDPNADELAPSDASLYLAMELLEGESLGARLKRRGRLAVEECGRIAREALLSLAEAHDKGIIHRDLKPDNIFLAKLATARAGETVKVLDFGIAKLRVEPSVDALETQAGTVFGTPRYMSPEQAQGKDLDARSDLYTLGVLLYQMLTGRPPFVDDDAVVVMARHIKSTPVAPAEAAPDVPIGAVLSSLVMRALAKDPHDRPRTAQEFLAELDRALADRGDDRPARSAAGASGEMAAVVHDGLGGPSSPRPPPQMTRARAVTLVGTTATVVAAVGLAAITALRAPRIPAARAEIGYLVAARRLAVMQALAPSAAPSASAVAAPQAVATPESVAQPPAPAPPLPEPPRVLPARRPAGKRYKKFDP